MYYLYEASPLSFPFDHVRYPFVREGFYKCGWGAKD